MTAGRTKNAKKLLRKKQRIRRKAERLQTAAAQKVRRLAQRERQRQLKSGGAS